MLVQFPDPHWKMRNRKKRIVQPQLVEAVAKLVAGSGRVFLQSDVEEVRLHHTAAKSAQVAVPSACIIFSANSVLLWTGVLAVPISRPLQ